MKTPLIAASAFFAFPSAFAAIEPPKAGQAAEYQYRSTESGSEVRQVWVIKQLGYDKKLRSYAKSLSLSEDGKIVDKYTLFPTPEETKRLMRSADVAKCAANEGRVERVSVPAGRFESCRITTAGDHGGKITVWYADVPEYTVKWIETDAKGETIIDAKLVRFRD